MGQPSFQPRHLDAKAFAQAGASLSGQLPVSACARLRQELREPVGDAAIDWQASGEYRSAADGILRPALHLGARAGVLLTCQRCLEAVAVPLVIDRHFVFAPDEATAEALDDASEDDVLALVPAPDLLELLEDELLMALPLVPRHEQCPTEVKLSASDADFDAALANQASPFAGLSRLRTGRDG